MKRQSRLRAMGRSMARWLLPDQRLRLTREGRVYLLIWLGLLGIGLQQQSNMILLIAGFASGPVVASVLVSGSMIKRVELTRRLPSRIFEGDPLPIDFMLKNHRRRNAALALTASDTLEPVESGSGALVRLTPFVMFPRVAGRTAERLRWIGTAPVRGRYGLRQMEVATRSPFGLLERRRLVDAPAELMVYPRVGRLTRRWLQRHRESTESRKGRRHERTVQQQEYHGLRDYRAGDSPRWIHWRTTARLGQPMVREFEQQNEQDVALLLDPWLPRARATPAQREHVEEAIRFAATVSLEICRAQGRRYTLAWTGPSPSVRQGPASLKLLHNILEQLALMRPSPEGSLAQLFDVIPPSTLRQAILVVVTTRALNLVDELERSKRLTRSANRAMLARLVVLDVSKGDQVDLIQYDRRTRRGPSDDPAPTPDPARAPSDLTSAAAASETPAS